MNLIPQRILFISFLVVCSVMCENKYSRSANEKSVDLEQEKVNFRTLEKPYRMNKLNIVWSKAQQRLTEPKLKSLYSDLMIQDKEELTYKRLKSEGGDKEGLLEAKIRSKLTNIMNVYNLREHFDDVPASKQKEHPAFNSATDDYLNRQLFKDKKLNQLWSKAETSGFTSEELAALKEEFMHHQDKIDQYYDILVDVEKGEKDGFKNALNEEELDEFNEIGDHLETNEIQNVKVDKANLIRDKHRGLRDNYDRLQRIAARGPENKEFVEPKVQGLWRMATESKFTEDELASLKVELHHYESRLLKLRTLHADHVNMQNQHGGKVASAGDKMDHFDHQQQMIKKHALKVDKMHADIESRILQRHNEL